MSHVEDEAKTRSLYRDINEAKTECCIAYEDLRNALAQVHQGGAQKSCGPQLKAWKSARAALDHAQERMYQHACEMADRHCNAVWRHSGR